MNEIQFSVSKSGSFVFRTDWMDTKDRATYRAFMLLAQNGYDVIVNHRPYQVYQSTAIAADTTMDQIAEYFRI